MPNADLDLGMVTEERDEPGRVGVAEVVGIEDLRGSGRDLGTQYRSFGSCEGGSHRMTLSERQDEYCVPRTRRTPPDAIAAASELSSGGES